MISGTAFSLFDGIDAESLLSREEEFGFEIIDYIDLDGGFGRGIACTSSSDDVYMKRWGLERFQARYSPHGIETIWGWNHEASGILPCSIYLRHVYLAAKSMGPEMLKSLLDETYLVDRKTTIRQYLENNPDVLETSPPESLLHRYNG